MTHAVIAIDPSLPYIPADEYYRRLNDWLDRQMPQRARPVPVVAPSEPLHQPPRDLTRVAVRTCPISGLESHR